MNLTQVENINDYPIKQNQRKFTDFVCIFIGVAFTVLILILCLVMVNYDHQIKTSFPSDSQGRVCGFDLPQFPFVYFTSFPKIQQRVCVSKCPSKDDTKLSCVPTQNIGCSFNSDRSFYVGFYENEPEISIIGSFCVPKDQNLKQQFYKASNISQRFLFLHNLSTIVISCLVALGLGIVYTFLVQGLPQKMNQLTLILGCLIVVVMIIFIMAYPNSQLTARIIFAIVLILFLITIYFTYKAKKGSLRIHGTYLQQATKVVLSNRLIVLYVPLFMGILVLFLLIIGFQLKCLWSSSGISFSQNYLYYQFQVGQTTVWTVLVFIQAVWGLSFIKQSFNFCISGNAVKWYYSQAGEIDQEQIQSHDIKDVFSPLKILILHHFGSVVAGSFLTGWFSLFDYIFDCLRPEGSYQKENQNFYHKCLSRFDQCLDLVRSDSMGYIYLTGNPYCNASRYCQFLCKESPLTQNSQSTSRAYRICAHFLLAGLVATVSILLQGKQTSVYIVAVVFMLSLFITTFFISLHADAAESIQIVLLMDQHFASKQLSQQQRLNFGQEVINNMSLKRQFVRQISRIYNQNMYGHAQMKKEPA